MIILDVYNMPQITHHRHKLSIPKGTWYKMPNPIEPQTTEYLYIGKGDKILFSTTANNYEAEFIKSLK